MIKRWGLVLLLTQLFVITLVQVRPQVDLPDTAFQGDSEPLAVHAIAVSSPLGIVPMTASVLCFGSDDLHHDLLGINSSAPAISTEAMGRPAAPVLRRGSVDHFTGSQPSGSISKASVSR
jgi:hypothetical protein